LPRAKWSARFPIRTLDQLAKERPVHKPVSLLVLLFGFVSSFTATVCVDAAAPDEVAKTTRKPYGIEKRTLWTTSKIHGTPDAACPYQTENAFPKLKFYEPLSMTVVPGTNRLVVAERPGKIFTFENDPKTDQKEMLVDVGRTIYGVVLHPQFQQNGYFYVSSELKREDNSPGEIQILRYRAAKPETLRADPDSAAVIITWPADGHRGGCMRFGPDGYLYIGVGDGSGIADQLQTGQDLSDLLGSMLRIDVDRPTTARRYSIPKDNPFAGTPGARGEIWAYGLRQPWKFSFDRMGNLWVGEVGQDLWEMVYLIQKGGNYGWSVTEGLHPFRPERAKGPSPILPPVVEHSHADFRSLTGGYVYYGSRLPELKGAYIYGDYDTGRIWALRHDGGKVTEHRELDDTQLRIVDFGQDAAGEIYIVDFMSGSLHRLVPAPPQTEQPADFPRKLSETGLFASTKNNQPAAGLIPYSVNAELWSDGAKKQRFLALPGDSQIEYDTVTYPQPAPGSEPGWRFPHDTVLVKTFSLETEAGNPNSLRRLETRILHHKHMPGTEEVGDQYWRGYTYVWNDEQTDAELLDASGLDRKFMITDPAAPGGKREQTWHFPSRAECTLCHTMSAKYALGVNTLQMNKDHDYGGVIANQLATLDHLGIFTKPLPKPPAEEPRVVDYRDESQDLNLRARSYLHANCSHCHRKWGGGNAEFQLLASLPLTETGTINIPPGQGRFDQTDPRIFVPGQPDRSMVLYRMQKLGLGRMPHVASNIVDEEAAKLIAQWIQKMGSDDSATRKGIE
jgi:uncharacterized repeat protein (TIGR03806 family)